MHGIQMYGKFVWEQVDIISWFRKNMGKNKHKKTTKKKTVCSKENGLLHSHDLLTTISAKEYTIQLGGPR